MQDIHTSILLHIPTQIDHKQKVTAYLENKTKIKITANNPNFSFFNEENITIKIAQIRKIIEQSSYAAYTKDKRFFILLYADKTTIPAQNALLKLLEEPPINTQLILTANQLEKLLPTIQSRCIIEKEVCDEKTKPTSLDSSASHFSLLTSHPTYSQLIDLAVEYKDREEAKTYILNLINQFQNENHNKASEKTTKSIKELLKVYQLLEKNVNVRLALEHCFFRIKELN